MWHVAYFEGCTGRVSHKNQTTPFWSTGYSASPAHRSDTVHPVLQKGVVWFSRLVHAQQQNGMAML